MILKKITFILIFLISFVAYGDGKETYEKYCVLCHSIEMSPIFGSPTVHDQDAWNERKEVAWERALDKKSTLNSSNKEAYIHVINELLLSAINGLNAMPPRGNCMECSDDDLKNAIIFMSSPE